MTEPKEIYVNTIDGSATFSTDHLGWHHAPDEYVVHHGNGVSRFPEQNVIQFKITMPEDDDD